MMDKRRTASLLLIVIIAVLSAFIFLYLLNIAVSGDQLIGDESVLLFFNQLRTPWFNLIFLGITHSATYYAPLPVILTTVFLWRRGERIQAVLPVISVASFSIIGYFIKIVVRRPRPVVVSHLMVEHSSSFPSGHTITAMSIYGLIAMLLWRRNKKMPAFLSALWVLMVAVSRVYLGVHYPSDVLASLMFGIILLVIMYLFDLYVTKQKEKEPVK